MQTSVDPYSIIGQLYVNNLLSQEEIARLRKELEDNLKAQEEPKKEAE